MTELLTAAQMRAIEQAAIASGEVTGLELMERAGRGVVEAILEWRDDFPQDQLDLSGADLQRFDLTGANLKWADLSHAKMKKCRLSGANLTQAVLSQAELRSADCRGAS